MMRKNISYFVFLVMVMGSYLCAEDDFNTPESLKERENKINAFVRQELEKGVSANEIQNAIKSQFFPLIPGTDEYKKLAADAERVRQAGYRCSDAAEVIEKLKLASEIRKKSPEYQAFKKLSFYAFNQKLIKMSIDELHKKQEKIQQDIHLIEEQNKTLLALFTLSQKTTNEREQAANTFVCQKLAAKIPVKAIEQELEEKFCKHIPEHQAISWLDRDKARLRKAYEPCRARRGEWYDEMEYCNSLPDEYKQNRDKLKQARKERDNAPEIRAAEKLSEYCFNETRIQKLKQNLEEHTEEINQGIRGREQENQTMFSEVV